MIKKKILHIDMDGVTCEFMTEIINKFPSICETDDKTRESIIDYFLEVNPRYFGTLEPIPGAIDAIHYLSDYFEIYFLTTPARNCAHSYMDKKLWLDQHIFDHKKISDKKLIMTHNKGLLMGDYLIDDRIANGVAEFQGKHLHFGEDKDFPTWKDIIDFLILDNPEITFSINTLKMENNT